MSSKVIAVSSAFIGRPPYEPSMLWNRQSCAATQTPSVVSPSASILAANAIRPSKSVGKASMLPPALATRSGFTYITSVEADAAMANCLP